MSLDTLNDIIDESAAKFGDKDALIIKPGFRTRAWTYRDLADIVPRIARHLAESGIKKEDRVITFGVNRPEYGIAVLAALRAGAVIVPLDVNSTVDFVKKIAQRTRASAVLVTAQTKERAAALGLPIHEMELLPDKARDKQPLPKPDVDPGDLAEVMFTSGTTGEPKGTMLTHRNLLASAIAATQIFPIGPSQRLLSFIPLSHIFEQGPGFLCVLVAGASVVYPTSRQPAVVRRTFKERKVSMILITPAAVRSLFIAIERKAEQDGKGELFAKLRRVARRLPLGLRRVLFTSVHSQFGGRFRYIVSGGAALDPAIGEAWRELGVDVLQGYGLSATAQRPTVAVVVGLERPGENMHVHAVFVEPKDPEEVASIVRASNEKLSGAQQIRGWTIWPDEQFPTTPTQKVKKREVIDRILKMGKDEPVTRPAAAAQRELTEVEAIVARVANGGPERIFPEGQLPADVGLDSLGRVDLLGVIEEELGGYIDDAALAPSATVKELETMVAAARDNKPDTGIFGWPLSPFVRSIGIILQQFLLWPLVHLFYRVKITGTEKLEGLRGPVMFAPNHCLHRDNGIILTSIPVAWRWKLAVAAAADDVFGNKLNGIFSAILANAFPLAREGAIRRSLELLGARLDRKFSVLIYPEGKLTIGGPMQPFKSGTGLIAVEGRTPVVPMKLKIGNVSILDHIDRKWEPFRVNGWRGHVEVVFGDPLYFAAGTSPAEATAKLQAAVAAL